MPYIFPFTTTGELNQDWILKQVQDFTSQENYDKIVQDVKNQTGITEATTAANEAADRADDATNAANAAAERANSAAATADNVSGLIAEPFDPEKYYSAGWYVTYEGTLYRFAVAHEAGPWEASEVVACKLADETSIVKGDLNDLITKIAAPAENPNIWIMGGLNSQTGNPRTSSTNRIYSQNANTGLATKVNNLVRLQAADGYHFIVFVYANNTFASYQGIYDGISIRKVVVNFKDLIIGLPEGYYYRVVLIRDDNADMNISEGENLHYYSLTDDSLTIPNVPADSASTGNKLRKILRIVQWNIGDYTWGFNPQTYPLTESQYQKLLPEYNRFLDAIRPDVLALQEYNHNFYVNVNGAVTTYSAKQNLFNNHFQNTTINDGSTLTCAMFSNVELIRSETYRLNGTEGVGVSWKIAEYRFVGITFTVCTGYLTASSDAAGHNMATREQELINLFNYMTEKGYQNVIVSLDTNCSKTQYEGPYSGISEGITDGAQTNYEAILKIAEYYEYQPVNSELWPWGSMPSYYDHVGTGVPGHTLNQNKPIDNIFVKGHIQIRNAYVLSGFYEKLSSDHSPLVLDVMVY